MTRYEFAHGAKTLLIPFFGVLFSLGACRHIKDPVTPAVLAAPQADASTPIASPRSAEAPAATPRRAQKGNPPLPHPSDVVGDDETAPVDPANFILFLQGSARLDDLAMARLKRHAAQLKGAPSVAVTLVAHTAPSGSHSYSLAVAEQRLRAVAKALRSLGVRGDQIRQRNAGSRPPPKPCESERCRLASRSIELVYAQ